MLKVDGCSPSTNAKVGAVETNRYLFVATEGLRYLLRKSFADSGTEGVNSDITAESEDSGTVTDTSPLQPRSTR